MSERFKPGEIRLTTWHSGLDRPYRVRAEHLETGAFAMATNRSLVRAQRSAEDRLAAILRAR